MFTLARQQVPAYEPRVRVEELPALYPNEWVVLVDLEVEDMVVRSGVVYAHDRDRAAVIERTRHLPVAAIRFAGPRRPPRANPTGHVDRAV